MISCNDKKYYPYNHKVVEYYGEHFRTLDSIEKSEVRQDSLEDSLEEIKNDSILLKTKP